MARPFPRLPITTEVAPGAGVGRVRTEGPAYQLLQEHDGRRVIWLVEASAPWLSSSDGEQMQRDVLVSDRVLNEIEGAHWLAGVFGEAEAPVCVATLSTSSFFRTAEQLLNLSQALANLEKLKQAVCWSTVLYVDPPGRCIATEEHDTQEDRLALATALVTGGVSDPLLSDRQIRALNRWISMPEIEEFFEILGLQKLSVRAVVRNTNIHPPEEFSIPGRPELESLFREYVIDYSRRSNEYRTGLPDTE